MSFGKRRPKPTRAQLRPPQPHRHPARPPGPAARPAWHDWSLVAVAVLVTAAIVHGSGPPFTVPPRPAARPRAPGQRAPSSTACNQKKTNDERQAAADQVPPSMVNDPAPIRDLAERLDDLTVTIAKSPRVRGRCPRTCGTTWKLEPRAYLRRVKAATDTPERRDNLHAADRRRRSPR